MLESNRRRVRNLTGAEIWMFILGRVLLAFGLGVLALRYFPGLPVWLEWATMAAGALLLAVASPGLLRKPPATPAT
jgi:hypothetical protein